LVARLSAVAFEDGRFIQHDSIQLCVLEKVKPFVVRDVHAALHVLAALTAINGDAELAALADSLSGYR
jgi:hypothetical protein